METIFLAIARCFNTACTDQQVYIEDVFQPEDGLLCEAKAERWAAQLKVTGAVNWRIGCRTQSQLEKSGV
jgi:hypothetical protein